MHEDARQVQLHLEAHVHVRAVDGRRPPQREAPVRDLVQTAALRVGKLLVLHLLLEARRLLPEQALPRGERRRLEQRVLQNRLHATQVLDHIRAVVVQVPQAAVVALVRPPQLVPAHQRVLLEHQPRAVALVVRQRVPVALEQRVDARQTQLPRVVQVLVGESPVARVRLRLLQRVLRPDGLRGLNLAEPGGDVAEQVGDQLVLLVAHAVAEVRDACAGLLGHVQVRLRNQDVAHAHHAQAAQLLRRVEHHGREARGHLAVEAHLDARLDLVLALHQDVQHLLRVDHRLAEVGHQPDQRRVPLVRHLRERRTAAAHQNLPHVVLERLHLLLAHAQIRQRRLLLRALVLQRPRPVARLHLLLARRAHLRQDAHLEAAHVEQQVRVVARVHAHERPLPLEGGQRPRQATLHVPEHGTAQVHVVLHQSHARVTRPALLVVVAHDVLVVGVRVLRQEALNQVLRLLRREPEYDVHLVHIARVQPDRVPRLRLRVVEGQILVRQCRRTCQLRRARHAQQQQIQNQPVVLEDEAGELQAGNQPVVIDVLHVLEGDLHVALLRHVIRQVRVHDQPQQTRQQRRVDLLEHLVERRLHQHVALAVVAGPEVRQVVDALAELVHQVRLRLLVARLHPVGEQLALVRLVPQVLVQVRVGDLLQRVDLVHGHQVRVQVQELQPHVLEHVLRHQVPLDLLQRLMGVVEAVFDQRQLVALQLVHAARAVVVLAQPLQRQRQQLRVVLVLHGRERDRREVPGLQPVDRRVVDGRALLRRHVRAVLQVVLLPLLLLLQEETR